MVRKLLENKTGCKISPKNLDIFKINSDIHVIHPPDYNTSYGFNGGGNCWSPFEKGGKEASALFKLQPISCDVWLESFNYQKKP